MNQELNDWTFANRYRFGAWRQPQLDYIRYSQQQALYDAQCALHIQAVDQAAAQRQNAHYPGLLGELGVGAALHQAPQRPPEQTGNPWRLWNVDKPPRGKLVATVLEISPTVEIHRSDDLETEHQMWWRLA